MKTNLNSVQLLSTLVLLTCSLAVSGQEKETVTAFLPPKPLDAKSPTYPGLPLSTGREGMVELNFMVDTNGKAFDPVVSYAYGDDDFQNAAIRALNRSTFTPAMLNGEPIVGSNTFRYNFVIDDQAPGASQKFISTYRKLMAALETDNRETTDIALTNLQKLEISNHYEDAFMNLANYTYAQKYGDEHDQMHFLHGALSFSNTKDDKVYFDDPEVYQMRKALLGLQLKQKYFPEALETYAFLLARNEEEATRVYGAIIEQIKALEYDDTEYGIPVVLSESGILWVNLFKHRIYLTGGEGSLNEIRLWCSQKYLAFEISRDFSYDIPDSWGDCRSLIVGDPGATAALNQH